MIWIVILSWMVTSIVIALFCARVFAINDRAPGPGGEE